jgi:hypothetical protein
MYTVALINMPFANLSIDYVFSGPALKSFPGFVRRCRDGQRDAIGQIRGIFDKENADALKGQTTIGDELEQLEDRDLIFTESGMVMSIVLPRKTVWTPASLLLETALETATAA